MQELELLRREVDELNLRLLDLLSRRAELALRIASLKHDHGWQFHDPDREGSMLSAVVHANRGPWRDDEVMAVFRTIIGVSREAAARRFGETPEHSGVGDLRGEHVT